MQSSADESFRSSSEAKSLNKEKQPICPYSWVTVSGSLCPSYPGTYYMGNWAARDRFGNGACGLTMGGLQGILTGLAESSDHPSTRQLSSSKAPN